MNINNYKDGSGNVLVSETLVSDIIGGINGITKEDVGLGKVLNEKQASIIENLASASPSYINLPTGNGVYLFTRTWGSSGNGNAVALVTVQGTNVFINEIKISPGVTLSLNGTQLIVDSNFWGLMSLIKLY